MHSKSLLLLVFVVIATASCVPISKITYLQESGTSKNDSLIEVRRVQSPYRLQINDVLSIQIKSDKDVDAELISSFTISNNNNQNNNQSNIAQQPGSLYFNGYTVDIHGDIRVPELGKIKAIGMTVEELQDYITKELTEKYFKPEAKIFVTVKLDGLRYTMVGEVTSPGQKRIFREQISIVEAIADGGGVPITGDLTDVKIVRQYPEGVRTHTVDLTRLDVVNSPYYFLRPNDMIVVNPLPQKSIGTGTTGLSTFTTILSVFTATVGTVLLINSLSN
ncbi:polysaccharide export outer membrane protein [Nonlabens tegetincola]|uniref:Polysaccharide export outer membrane protein n=1 Tax=Nonlabens tegetincola TaxID=323273 RepID=A0A090Q035_9FLAO|nr:polysaccharide biosynthesis/export family protein [Nonlabens tegetincola]GAK96449.1 polysaccharide export outer membrane protein [Nonlabens tegetincola]